MKKNICTYFDSAFFGRGQAMITSLIKKSSIKNIKVFVLAIDKSVENRLNALELDQLVVINLNDFKANDIRLSNERFQNSKEFFFSLTPGLCLYCLKKFQLDSVMYVDADVYFFNDIKHIYEEIGGKSIGLCSHRLPFFMRPFSLKYGVYNVGINYFKNDDIGLLCLEDWNEFCLNWTPQFPGWKLPFFSDQVWLDDWPKKYSNLKIINNIGVNTAPWNAIKYTFKFKNGTYYVNNTPLIAYHFSNLGKLDDKTWEGNIGQLFINIQGTLLQIYAEYINQIDRYEISFLKGVNSKRNVFKKFVFSFFKKFFNSKIDLK